MTLTISTSAIRDYRRCPRLYRHKHVDRVVAREEAKALRIGTTVHNALNAWHVAAWWGQRKGRLLAALAELERERDEYERARAKVMLLGYHAMWSGCVERVVAVEHEFCVLLYLSCLESDRNVELHGRIDALVEIDGRYYIREHKTTSADIHAGSLYWRQRRMDPQISNYDYAQRELGVNVAGTIYDVLKKPAHRPSADESPLDFERRMLSAVMLAPDTYYARRIITRLDFERERAKRDLLDNAEQIGHSRKLNVFPHNFDACLDYGRTCEFFEVCAGERSLEHPSFVRR